MKITPTSLTISQLLGSDNEQYVIPAYQRRYSWKRHQVQDVWDDLEILEAADSHLFGTIGGLAGPHTAGVNQLELVDGRAVSVWVFKRFSSNALCQTGRPFLVLSVKYMG